MVSLIFMLSVYFACFAAASLEFLLSCLASSRPNIADTNKGRRWPSIGLGSAPLAIQEPPLLLQRITETITMGAPARNRYGEAQELYG